MKKSDFLTAENILKMFEIIALFLAIVISVLTMNNNIKEAISTEKDIDDKFNIYMKSYEAEITKLEEEISVYKAEVNEYKKINALSLYKDLANIVLTQPQFADVVSNAYNSISDDYTIESTVQVIEEMNAYAQKKLKISIERGISNLSNPLREERIIAIDEILLTINTNPKLLDFFLEKSIAEIGKDSIEVTYGYNNMLFVADYFYHSNFFSTQSKTLYDEMFEMIEIKRGVNYSNEYLSSMLKKKSELAKAKN